MYFKDYITIILIQMLLFIREFNDFENSNQAFLERIIVEKKTI
jgi:hypothetical protein